MCSVPESHVLLNTNYRMRKSRRSKVTSDGRDFQVMIVKHSTAPQVDITYRNPNGSLVRNVKLADAPIKYILTKDLIRRCRVIIKYIKYKDYFRVIFIFLGQRLIRAERVNMYSWFRRGFSLS